MYRLRRPLLYGLAILLIALPLVMTGQGPASAALPGPTMVYPSNGQKLRYPESFYFRVNPVPGATEYLYGFFQNNVMVWENYANEREFFPGDSLTDDLRVAITAVNGYWAAHWSDLLTGTYTPPRYNRATLGLYDGFSRYAPTCRGKRMAPLNAGYCRPEDFLAWDETFMRNGYAKGDGFVYTTVAHEWGHAIQNRLRVVVAARESQADCLAGAELYGTARDGRLQFQAGDEAEIARTLSDTADYMPPANGGRGTPSDRMGAFRLGATYGTPACLRIR